MIRRWKPLLLLALHVAFLYFILIVAVPDVRDPIKPKVHLTLQHDVLRMPEDSDVHIPSVDSTIVMFYNSENSIGFQYPDLPRMKNVNNACLAELFKRFAVVGAAFQTDPQYQEPNPAVEFPAQHKTSLWAAADDGVMEPLQIDVVYTHVEPTAPSFARAKQERGASFEKNANRVRDWDEIQYSLRTLAERLVKPSKHFQSMENWEEDVSMLISMGYKVRPMTPEMLARPLVRNLYIVVSDLDQMPPWLDAESFPLPVKTVTHKELVYDNESHVLPTFNSVVVESLITRIANLSSNFLYFNNDILLGRETTLFDYFRPFAPPRSLLQLVKVALDHMSLTNAEPADPCQLVVNGAKAARKFVFMESAEPMPAVGDKSYTKYQEGPIVIEAADQTKKFLNSLSSRLTSLVECKKLQKVLWSGAMNHSGFRTSHIFRTTPSSRNRRPLGAPHALHYSFSLYSHRLEGFIPFFFFFHRPHMINKMVSDAITEFQFREETQTLRYAYMREMNYLLYPEMYAMYNLAVMRAVVRQTWLRMFSHMDTVKSWFHVYSLLEEMVMKRKELWRAGSRVAYTATRLHMRELGPLYGSYTSVNVQSLDLLEELAFWWDNKHRQASRTHVARVDILGSIQQDSQIKNTRWHKTLELYYDHGSHKNEDLFISATSAEGVTRTAAKYEATTQKPFAVCVNDDFTFVEGDQAAFDDARVAMRALFELIAKDCPRGAWERNDTGNAQVTKPLTV